jgi:hypothetical protein
MGTARLAGLITVSKSDRGITGWIDIVRNTIVIQAVAIAAIFCYPVRQAEAKPARVPAPKIRSNIYNGDQVRAFDIAGVRLLMSPSEARTALQSRGYNIQVQMNETNWENSVVNELTRRNPNSNSRSHSGGALSAFIAQAPSGEKVSVWFKAASDTPEGVRVSGVVIGFTDGRFDMAAVRRAVLLKYGPPTVDLGPTTTQWGQRRANGLLVQPYLEWQDGKLYFQSDLWFQPRLETSIRIEADRRQPPITKPNF